MSHWKAQLQRDPIQPLLSSGNEVIAYFTGRDLLGEAPGSIKRIWGLPEVQRILRRQQADGSWKPRGQQGGRASGACHPLTETWRQLRYLVQQYAMDRGDPAIARAAEYVFSCQSDEGDLRGILANQYAAYYTGAILYLLIKAGYAEDPRTEKALHWLLEVRQSDGGWVIGSPGMVGLPKLTVSEANDLTSNCNRETQKAFDHSKPFSAAGTGMAIRAFAAHPIYRQSEAALAAARLLKGKFFKQDNWSSYRHPDNWVRFQFPFWWTNLVTALDALSLIGVPREDEDVARALKWLIDHQEEGGLWRVSYSRIHKSVEDETTHPMKLWLTLAICRIFKRFRDAGC